jgi:hypothetical protein
MFSARRQVWQCAQEEGVAGTLLLQSTEQFTEIIAVLGCCRQQEEAGCMTPSVQQPLGLR